MSIFESIGDTSKKALTDTIDRISKAPSSSSSWFTELQNKVYEQMKANDEKNKQAELEKRIRETEKQFEDEYRKSHYMRSEELECLADVAAPVAESMRKNNAEIKNYINKNLFE